ncbi:MAG: magnesium transporter CorA family protein [bacterium]|nr:magnesium transporter CorA family protein [bacterium]
MRNVLEHGGITWVDIQDPTKEDVEYLRANFSFHPVVLDQLLPPSWGTKVEQFASHIFFVLFFPVYSKERRDTRPRELDIIVADKVLVSSHYNTIIPLKGLFDECNIYEELREKHMGKGVGFLLHHLLRRILEDCSGKVRRINQKLTLIEESVFEGKEREMLKEIAFAKADILNFWRIVRPQKGAFTSLRDISSVFFGEHLTPYFSHLRNHWARIMSDLIAYKETIKALEETNNALLTDKTNEIVKLLTIFAVIVFPLSLLAGIFGMNTTYLPIVGLPGDFWIVTGLMATGTFIMIVLFKKKKWF